MRRGNEKRKGTIEEEEGRKEIKEKREKSKRVDKDDWITNRAQK